MFSLSDKKYLFATLFCYAHFYRLKNLIFLLTILSRFMRIKF